MAYSACGKPSRSRGRAPSPCCTPSTWLPGNHSPTGPIDKLAGLTFTVNGAPVSWRRDPVDVYAFHLDAPPGASSLDVSFQFLSAVSGREGRVVMTPDMLSLQWNTVALYPAGYFSRQVMVEPSVMLPEGFTLAGALETASTAGNTTTFKPTPFNTLVDSPLIAGRYFHRFDLDPGAPTRVSLDVVADRPELLAATDAELAAHTALVQQAYRLYASHRYDDHYDFLLSISDRMGGIGLEHHRSSEDGVAPKYFTDWDKTAPERDLLPHEVHPLLERGKFRRAGRPVDAELSTMPMPRQACCGSMRARRNTGASCWPRAPGC